MGDATDSVLNVDGKTGGTTEVLCVDDNRVEIDAAWDVDFKADGMEAILWECDK